MVPFAPDAHYLNHFGGHGPRARFVLGVLLACAIATSAGANAPDTSLRPVLRPGGDISMSAPRLQAGLAGVLRPRLRPGYRPGGGVAVATTGVSVQPASAVGRICRDTAIRGEVLRPIQSNAGCNIAAPVRVHRVEGVEISPPAIMDCATAIALKDWVKGGVVPAVGRLGRGLARIQVGAALVCSPLANSAARVVETHQGGNAIDLRALTLKNGVSITVSKGWRDPFAGQVLRKIHAAGCGPFKTVLGPEAGSAYRDRIHLDTGPRRGRRICR